MEGTLSVQRIYNLGDYQNITIKTELTNVPSDFIEDEVKTNTLQLIMLLNVETAYRTYVDLLTKIPRTMDTEMALAELESLRKATYQLIRGRQDESENQYQHE